MDQIVDMLNKLDNWVWDWWMIALLFGTHLFMTIRTGFIQRQTVAKGIKLSVTKDTDGEGEVSQFGALATALAATIGTGNIVGVWNCNKVFGVTDCSKIQSEDEGRTYAGRCYVCP